MTLFEAYYQNKKYLGNKHMESSGPLSRSPQPIGNDLKPEAEAGIKETQGGTNVTCYFFC